MTTDKILVIGGTGKTGRRVVERLAAQGFTVQGVSRSSQPAFDWQNPDTWEAALQGSRAVYISYQPDLAVPGAEAAIRRLTEVASAVGVEHLVLLAGRGEPEAEVCEKIVQASGLGWTIIRAAWFNQNFSEDFLRDAIVAGELVLPVGAVKEPFIDAEDIADVAVAALTHPQAHHGQVYEVTGPRLLDFAEVAAEISQGLGHPIHFISVTLDDFKAGLAAAQVPADYIWLLDYLFSNVLDGRNAWLGDGVQRALGRAPQDFSDFVKRSIETGVWYERTEQLE